MLNIVLSCFYGYCVLVNYFSKTNSFLKYIFIVFQKYSLVMVCIGNVFHRFLFWSCISQQLAWEGHGTTSNLLEVGTQRWTYESYASPAPDSLCFGVQLIWEASPNTPSLWTEVAVPITPFPTRQTTPTFWNWDLEPNWSFFPQVNPSVSQQDRLGVRIALCITPLVFFNLVLSCFSNTVYTLLLFSFIDSSPAK